MMKEKKVLIFLWQSLLFLVEQINLLLGQYRNSLEKSQLVNLDFYIFY